MSLSKTKYRKKKLKKSNRKRKYSPKNQTRRKRRTRKYKKQKGGSGATGATGATGSDGPKKEEKLEDKIKALIESLEATNLAKAFVKAQTKAEEAKAKAKAKSDAVKKVNTKERREDVKVIIYDSLGNKIKYKFEVKNIPSGNSNDIEIIPISSENEKTLFLHLVNQDSIDIKYKSRITTNYENINYLKRIFLNNELKFMKLKENKYNFKIENIVINNDFEDIKKIIRIMITLLGILVFENIQSEKKNYIMDINIKINPELKEFTKIKELNPGFYLGKIMNHVYEIKKGSSTRSTFDSSKNLIEFFDNLGYSIEYKNNFRYILTINPT